MGKPKTVRLKPSSSRVQKKTSAPRENPVTAHVLPAEGIVRLPTVLAVLGISKSTWWRGIEAGRYPKGVKIGPNATAWNVRQIRELIERGAA